VFRAGDLALDDAAHVVSVRGRSVDLTATEYRILEFLMSHPDRVWSRTEIIDTAMERDEAVIDRTVDVHLTALRRKIGREGDRIETVRGFGYKFRSGG
jgi:two-component system phosphate regulon response regulator PhoB